jgi:membrane-associated protein
MPQHLFQILRGFFQSYGYWTVAIALLLENAGVPVPGETILLFASFLAYSKGTLSVPFIILVAVAAATLGDNLGYAIGHRGGRPLLERYKRLFRIRAASIERGELLFERYGAPTIFFARFIFGMRIIAGPLAGVLRMPWKKFVIFNFLGAVAWVTSVSLVGYFFGSEWPTLLRLVRRLDFIIFAVAAIVVLLLWWRHRRKPKPPAGPQKI